MKVLAREERKKHGITTSRVLRSDLRKIYKEYGIQIDIWSHFSRKIRGAYFCDQYGASVALNPDLPDDPYIFTMAHELKHHLVDSIMSVNFCGENNEFEPIEIGAEVFAAELLFPEQDFADQLMHMGVLPGGCTPDKLVRLKHETKTTLSFTGLAKRAEFMGFASKGMLTSRRIHWKKLEEQIYGEPIYKRIQRNRKRA
jgi:Zn-dependent peptidase ImmA (M78 family)